MSKNGTQKKRPNAPNRTAMITELADIAGTTLIAGCCTQGCCKPFINPTPRIPGKARIPGNAQIYAGVRSRRRTGTPTQPHS
jgi:hypothetical protein